MKFLSVCSGAVMQAPDALHYQESSCLLQAEDILVAPRPCSGHLCREPRPPQLLVSPLTSSPRPTARDRAHPAGRERWTLAWRGAGSRLAARPSARPAPRSGCRAPSSSSAPTSRTWPSTFATRRPTTWGKMSGVNVCAAASTCPVPSPGPCCLCWGALGIEIVLRRSKGAKSRPGGAGLLVARPLLVVGPGQRVAVSLLHNAGQLFHAVHDLPLHPWGHRQGLALHTETRIPKPEEGK